MNLLVDKYQYILYNTCRNLQFNAFPQVEASTLLHANITLEDIYLPLSLTTPPENNDLDLDEIIRKIDEKIAYLESLVEKEKASSEQNTVPILRTINQTTKKDPFESYFSTIGFSKGQKHKLEIKQNPKENENSGLRVYITAAPGSGKTTFCKRLILAIINHDHVFFDKYVQENDLHFSYNTLPVLVNCKNVADLSRDDLIRKPFIDILYKLNALRLGAHLSGGFSRKDFIEIFRNNPYKKATIILDGWDEILDTEKAQLFIETINRYYAKHPHADVIITSRPGYDKPMLSHGYSHSLAIQEFSSVDIKNFCERWQKIIWKDTQILYPNGDSLASQILNSNEIHIKKMRKNPLELSFLLTVSGNEGRLPDNKADLFSKLVDLYIYWGSYKSHEFILSSKSMRIVLSYIAAYYTKKGLFSCDKQHLIEITKQCFSDLDWTLQEDLSGINYDHLIDKLTQTSLITLDDAHRYSFSDNSRFSHRQLQEYLTAYAISEQYSDSEDNEKTPAKIIEDKYDNRQWKEIIVFLALMNDGRTRHLIVNTLLSKAEDVSVNNQLCKNILFELIVNGADLFPDIKHKIYDILFANEISVQQVSSIFLLLSSKKKNKNEFVNYIDEQFKSSVNNGESQYGFAKAIIEIYLIASSGKNPFDYAEELIETNDSIKIVTSTEIIIMLSWFKYANILRRINDYLPDGLIYYVNSGFKTLNYVKKVVDLMGNPDLRFFLLKAFQEIIIAKYASFTDFFSINDIRKYYQLLLHEETRKSAEIILSMVPVFIPQFTPPKASSRIKEEYLNTLYKQIQNKQYSSAIFSFCLCAALGCWEKEEINKEWAKIDSLYKDGDYENSIGKFYYVYLKEEINNIPIIDITDPDAAIIWSIARKTNTTYTYIYQEKKMVISFPNGKLTDDAKYVLKDYISENTDTKNNLAYLLRRKELSSIKISSPQSKYILSPMDLLQNGVDVFHNYSVINYALIQSGISATRTRNNINIGLKYLLSIRENLYMMNPVWQDLINWWMTLAREAEFEGMTVILWLYKLGIFIPSEYSHSMLIDLLHNLNELPRSQIKYFPDLIHAIEVEINQYDSINE